MIDEQDDPFAQFGGQALKPSAPVAGEEDPFASFGGRALQKKPLPSGSKSTGKPFVDGGGIDPISLINTTNATAPYAPITDPHTRAINQAHQVRAQKPPKPVSAPKQQEERGIMDDISNALYIPAIKQGFNDLIFKPGAGAVDFIDRTIDKAYSGITGEATPDWLRKKGIFHEVSKQIQDEYDKRDKPTNVASEAIEGVAGTLPLIASMYTGQGEATLAAKAPQLFGKLSKVLATTGGLTGYKEATERGEGYVQSLGSAATDAAKGGIQGQFMDAQMLVGGALGKGVAEKLAEKGLLKGGKAAQAILHALSVGTVFGGTSAGEDLLSGRDINTHEALKQFGTGLAFEMIPTAQGINAELKDRAAGKKINEQTLQSAAVASSASNMNAESAIRTLINTPVEQLVKIKDEVPGTHEDLYADSIEQGAKAYEEKNPNEKRNLYVNQLLLKAQGDVKLVSDRIGKDREGLLETINSSEELTPEQKTDLSDKIEALSPEKTGEPTPVESTPETALVKPVLPIKTGEPTPVESVSETAPEPVERNAVTINEVVGKPVKYKGEDAEVVLDGQTLVAKIKGSNREYELGNAEEIEANSIKDYGIEHVNSVVDIADNGNLTVRGKEVINNYSDPKQAINYDNDGNVVSVNLETPDGKKRTFKGDVAEDIAYQIHLKELDKNNETRQQFEQFVEQHEPSKAAIVAAEDAITTEKGTIEDNAAVSRKPAQKIKPVKVEVPVVEKPVKTKIAEPAILEDTEKLKQKTFKNSGEDWTHLTNSKEVVDKILAGEDFIGKGEDLKNFTKEVSTARFPIGKENGGSPYFQKGKFYGEPTQKYLIVAKGDEKFTPNVNRINAKSLEESKGVGVLNPEYRTPDNFEVFERGEDGEYHKIGESKPEPATLKAPEKNKSLNDTEVQRKAELRKKFSGALNDVTRIPTLLLDKEFREYAGLVFKEAAGDFKAFSKELIENVGEKIREHLPQLHKELQEATGPETGNRLEDTARTREQMGFEAYERTTKKQAELEKEADDAMSAGYPVKKLIGRMEKGELPSDVEQLIMRKYISSLEASIDKAPAPETIADLKRAIEVSDKVGGTELARSLAARRGTIAKEDNLANFLLDEMNATGAEALQPEQIKDLDAKFKKGKAAEAKYKEGVERKQKEVATDKAEEAVKKIRKTTKPRPRKTREEFVKERAEAIEKMRADLLKAAKGGYGAMSSIPLAPQLQAIAPHVTTLVRSHVEEGLVNLNEIIKKIHTDLKDVVEGIEEKDVRDLIAGEYKEKKATRNEIAVQIHDLALQARMLKRLEDIENSTLPKTEGQKAVRSKAVEELKAQIKEAEDKAGITDERSLKAKRTYLKNQIEKLKKDIAENNFDEEPAAPKKLKLDVETEKYLDEYIAFQKETNLRRDKARYERMSKTQKAWDTVQQILGLRRLVQTSIDFSMPFRQAVTVTINPRHLKVTGKAFSNMFATTFNPKKYDRMMHTIESSPDYKAMAEDKLKFSSVENINNHDEDFKRSFAYKIPYVRGPLMASERAATAFINTARYELYQKAKMNFERQGITRENSPETYTEMAKWVNNITGRGNLIKFLEESPQAQNVLGNTFYGSRLMASRFNLLNPIYYTRMPKAVRVEALKDMGAYTATLLATGLALQASGASITLDPDNPDFMKAKFGDTRYDLTGGMVQYVRTYLRLAKAAEYRVDPRISKKKSNKYGAYALKSATSFFRYKLAPNTSYAINAISGTDPLGKDFDPYEILKVYPMYADDMATAYKQQGPVSALTILAPSLFGVGVQTYKK